MINKNKSALFLLILMPGLLHSKNLVAIAENQAISQLTLDEAVKNISRSDGGKRVLAAKTEDNSGKIVYVLKVLTHDGRLQFISINAENGQIIERKDTK